MCLSRGGLPWASRALRSNRQGTGSRGLVGLSIGRLIFCETTIAGVREGGRYLRETDYQLVEMIVRVAPIWGLLIAFDVREA